MKLLKGGPSTLCRKQPRAEYGGQAKHYERATDETKVTADAGRVSDEAGAGGALPRRPGGQHSPAPRMKHPMSQSHSTVTGLPFDAVLFDLDGVVTNTAAVHAAAWKVLFDPIVVARQLPGFDSSLEYLRYLDGQTREEGILRFLESRGIAVPRGGARDSASDWSAFGLGKKKNDLFLARIKTEGVRVFPETASLLQRLRDGKVPVGLVSSSRNTHAVIAAARISDMFDTVVDGQAVELLQLKGKPDPSMFLEAVRRLGVKSAKTAVVEDAVAGVEAGRRGGFGLVVGVNRSGQQQEALEAAGARGDEDGSGGACEWAD